MNFRNMLLLILLFLITFISVILYLDSQSNFLIIGKSIQFTEIVLSFLTYITVLIIIFTAIYNIIKRRNENYIKIWFSVNSGSADELYSILSGSQIKDNYISIPFYEGLINRISKSIANEKNVIICGKSLSGKKRLLIESFKKINEPIDIIIPKISNLTSNPYIPFHFKFMQKKYIIIENFLNFVENDNFKNFYLKLKSNNISIISFCHSQDQLIKISNSLLEKHQFKLDDIFNYGAVDIPLLTSEQIRDILLQNGISFDPNHFDGTIGSIFNIPPEICNIFENCNSKEKTILKSIKKLYISGFFEKDGNINYERIEEVARNNYSLDLPKYEWIEQLDGLKKKGLISYKSIGKISINNYYLNKIIKFDAEDIDISNIQILWDTYNSIDEVNEDYLLVLAKKCREYSRCNEINSSIIFIDDLISSSNNKIKILIEKSRVLRDCRNYAKAKDCLDKCLNIIKDEGRDDKNLNFLLFYQIGVTYCKWKKYPDALLWFNKSLDIKNDSIIYSLTGYAECQLENYEDSLKSYDKAIEMEKNNPDNWLGRGNVLVKLNQDDEALNSYNKSAELDPNNSLIWRKIGDEYTKSNNYEKALEFYKKSINLEPNNCITLRKLGDIYQRLKEYEEALSSYDEALEIEPGNSFTLIGRGYTFVKLERYEEALSSYDKVLEIEPGNILALIGRGNTLVKLERNEDALKLYKKAINIDVNNPFTYLALGELLLKLERYDEALNSINQGLKTDPNNISMMLHKTDILYKANRFEEALEILEKASILNPENHLVWRKKGNNLFKLNNFEDALISFNKSCDLNGNNCLIWQKKGETLTKLKRDEEASESYNKALQLEPDNFYIISCLGDLYFRMGNYEETFKLYNKAIKINPKDGIIYSKKGTLCEIIGKNDEALESFEKAVELNPQDSISMLKKQLFSGNISLESLGNLEKAVINSDGLSKKQKGILYFNLGIHCYKIREYEIAIKYFTKSAESDPSIVLNNLFIANSHYKSNHYDDALKYYNEYLNSNPPNEENYLTAKADCLRYLNYFDDALSCYDQILDKNPENIRAINGKAQTLVSKGKYKEAYELFLKAYELIKLLSIDQKKGFIIPLYDNIGYCLSKMGRYSEAIEFHKKVIEIRGSYVSGWHNLIWTNIFNEIVLNEKKISELPPLILELYKQAIENIEEKDKNKFINKFNERNVDLFKHFIFEDKIKSREDLISKLEIFENKMVGDGIKIPTLEQIEINCRNSSKFEVYKEKINKIFSN